jgi:flagellar motor switch protein FliG
MAAGGAIVNTLEQAPLTGTRKAAILLSLLGEDAAAVILRNLSEDDLQRVTEEVANLNFVPAEVSLGVLEEFQQMMADQEFTAMGGRDLTARLLTKAFGDSDAKSMMQRFTPNTDEASIRVDSLKKADPQQLARFLVGEHSQTKALILSHLEAKQASALLMKLEPEVRADCVRRLANLGQYSPDVAAKVSSVLNRRLRSVGDQGNKKASGFRNVAELMNRLDPTTAREILETMEREEPKLAIGIRDLMFTFEDFLAVPEQTLRELIGSIDKKTLMIALKGASEELRSHFYRTMSSRAVETMKEDSDVMGPVRSKDVAKAHSEIVAIARKLESEGKIVLKSEGEDEYVL